MLGPSSCPLVSGRGLPLDPGCWHQSQWWMNDRSPQSPTPVHWSTSLVIPQMKHDNLHSTCHQTLFLNFAGFPSLRPWFTRSWREPAILENPWIKCLEQVQNPRKDLSSFNVLGTFHLLTAATFCGSVTIPLPEIWCLKNRTSFCRKWNFSSFHFSPASFSHLKTVSSLLGALETSLSKRICLLGTPAKFEMSSHSLSPAWGAEMWLVHCISQMACDASILKQTKWCGKRHLMLVSLVYSDLMVPTW